MIVGIYGDLSSGKNLLALKLVQQHYKNGEKVITNFKSKYATVEFDKEELIEKIKEDKDEIKSFFENSILIIDEAHNYYQSHRSSSNLNILMNTFLTQCGKIDCNVIYISQLMGTKQIDTTLRFFTSIWCICERHNTDGVPLIFEPRIVPYPILIHVDMIIMAKAGLQPLHQEFYFDPSDLFDNYETRERIIIDRDLYLKK